MLDLTDAQVILYQSPAGELYGLCSAECMGVVKSYQRDPTVLKPEPEAPALHGCWWCGADLTGGAMV